MHAQSHSGPPWLVVGLGNPGARYRETRHNAGSRAVQGLSQALGIKLRSNKAQALAGDGRREGVRLVLACPTTFMNESGRAVAALIRQKDARPENLVIVHDEIDLPAGSLKVKFGGGAAGHHGVESVVQCLGTGDFYRVRIGVGRSSNPAQTADRFVLEPVPGKQAAGLAEVESRAGQAVLSLILRGLEPTMNQFNSVPRPSDE